MGDTTGYPFMLRAEIPGPATGLDDAQRRLGDRAGSLFPLVALAANAAHADPGLVVAHASRPAVDRPAEWIAYEWPPASEHVPPHSRTIDPNLVRSCSREPISSRLLATTAEPVVCTGRR